MEIRNRQRLLAAAFVLCLAMPAAPAAAETVNWQDHHIMPASFWLVANESKFAKELAEETGGRLQINILPSGASGFKGTEAMDAVSENLLQMAYVAGGHVAGQEQVMELLDLPQFVPGDFEFRKKLWDTLLPMYRDLLADRYNIWLMDVIQYNPRRLYTKVEVKKLDDLKGLKIRAIGPADADFIEALGAQSTTTAWTELYTALQQGVVDGHMAADGPHLSMRFNDVTKYIFDTENAGPSVFTMVSKSALDALPADVQKAFFAKEAIYRERNRSSYISSDEAARKALVEQGSKVNPVPEKDQLFMREAATPIVERWAAKLDPEAKKIYDKAREMIDAYYKTQN